MRFRNDIRRFVNCNYEYLLTFDISQLVHKIPTSIWRPQRAAPGDGCPPLPAPCYATLLHQEVMTKINRLHSFSNSLPSHTFLTIYKTNISPIFDYGSIIYDNCSGNGKYLQDEAQLSAASIILGCLKTTSSSEVLLDLNLRSLYHRRQIPMLRYVSKIILVWYPDLSL